MDLDSDNSMESAAPARGKKAGTSAAAGAKGKAAPKAAAKGKKKALVRGADESPGQSLTG